MTKKKIVLRCRDAQIAAIIPRTSEKKLPSEGTAGSPPLASTDFPAVELVPSPCRANAMAALTAARPSSRARFLVSTPSALRTRRELRRRFRDAAASWHKLLEADGGAICAMAFAALSRCAYWPSE